MATKQEDSATDSLALKDENNGSSKKSTGFMFRFGLMPAVTGGLTVLITDRMNFEQQSIFIVLLILMLAAGHFVWLFKNSSDRGSNAPR
ncbi:MAG: hypothetical protein AAF224_05785 [Pseudomonadota bacterium]